MADVNSIICRVQVSHSLWLILNNQLNTVSVSFTTWWTLKYSPSIIKLLLTIYVSNRYTTQKHKHVQNVNKLVQRFVKPRKKPCIVHLILNRLAGRNLSLSSSIYKYLPISITIYNTRKQNHREHMKGECE